MSDQFGEKRYQFGVAQHEAFLLADARRQIDFFRASLRADGAFDVLDPEGRALAQPTQELHTTTRLVHSFALAKALGAQDVDRLIDAGMDRLWSGHRDREHGGYASSIEGREIADGTKLAYGHVFVLLAASSARDAGHPDADRLLADIAATIDRHFWDETRGILVDEFQRDWSPFSTYRGMNANMHGAEAFLAAFEATGEAEYLRRAGRILAFFTGEIAGSFDGRIPEHYGADWTIDPDYEGDPMFRPAGTTPGHSVEFARLVLQHWDLAGRPATDARERARRLVERALGDGWRPDGGFVYTVDLVGRPLKPDRYWWPVTEGIGALASLLKVEIRSEDAASYERLWRFADEHFIDPKNGGWFPEIDEEGRPTDRQFKGKPDLYHSLQAALIPLSPGLSRLGANLRRRWNATSG